MGVIYLKKAKNRLIAILLLFLLSSSSFILSNNVKNNASNSLIQDINSPNLSNSGKSLLHSYDFEDETIGQDPTYESFTAFESSQDHVPPPSVLKAGPCVPMGFLPVNWNLRVLPAAPRTRKYQ